MHTLAVAWQRKRSTKHMHLSSAESPHMANFRTAPEKPTHTRTSRSSLRARRACKIVFGAESLDGLERLRVLGSAVIVFLLVGADTLCASRTRAARLRRQASVAAGGTALPCWTLCKALQA